MMNLTEAVSEGAIGSREIEATHFTAQTASCIEDCSFFCFDNGPISFAAKMRYEARSAFSPSRRKINIWECSKGREIAVDLKGVKGLDNNFVIEAIKAKTEIALRFQKRGKPTETVQRNRWGKFFHSMTGNDVKIR